MSRLGFTIASALATWVDAGSAPFEHALSTDPETRAAWLRSAITLHLLATLAAPLNSSSEELGKAPPGGLHWVDELKRQMAEK